MRSELRESETERGGEIKVRRGGEVYELLNARLTTGGSSTVDPIKCKQKKKNRGSVQLLCDFTSNNAACSNQSS